jgi:hypothetical protein
VKATIIGLAVLGAAAGGLLGAKWVADAAKYRDAIAQLSESGAAPEAVAQAKSLTAAGYLLIPGAVVAVPAAVASVRWDGKETVCGAPVVGCAVVPAVFAAKSLLFTFLLPTAGGLAVVRGWKRTPARSPQPEQKSEPQPEPIGLY